MNFTENASKQKESLVYLYVAPSEEKNSFCYNLSPFNGLIKNSCLNNPNFPQDLPLFKLIKKNKLSVYF